MTNEIFSKAEIELLKSERVARIATIDPANKQPHIVPICFAFDGKRIVTTLSFRSKRLRNVEQTSKVAILVDRYEETRAQWKILRGLLIHGNARILKFHDNREEFMNGWQRLMQKYPQYKQWANADLTPKDPDTRRVMKIEPTKITRWGFE